MTLPNSSAIAFVALDQQFHGGVAARRRGVFVVLVHAHAAGGVDARTDLEDDVVDGDVVLVQTADLDDRQQTLRRLAVEVFEAEMRQNAVFAHQRHDVRGDAHYQQVQQRADLLERHPVFLRIGLHEFESHAAARQFVERVGTIDPLGVQNGYGPGNLLGREVMVADDEIHALRLRIDNLFRGFDAAVQGDDKPHALAGGEVDTFDRNTVSFGITVGDVEHQVFVPDLAQELVNQRDGRTAVHVVVAVNHDLLLVRTACSTRSTALSMSFIRNGSWRSARLGLKNLSAFSTVSMPLCTSRLASTGEIRRAAASMAAVAGSPCGFTTHRFSIGIRIVIYIF